MRPAPAAATWLLEQSCSRAEHESVTGDLLEQYHLGRGRLLGALGGLTGIVFLLLIIAQWMAVCLLKPCPTYE